MITKMSGGKGTRNKLGGWGRGGGGGVLLFKAQAG